MANVHFVTGYPGFLGKRLAMRLLERDRKARMYLLVQPRFARDVRRELRRLEPRMASRVTVLVGDVVDMHLGLAGDEYRKLAAEVTHIFHLAAISYLGVDKRTLERVNVEGTRNVLELARDAKKLVRMAHVSTVYVAGDREGVVDEEELEEGQRFHNDYEETKFRAEVLVRKAMAELPITVFRPATIVGDSRTGEFDRLDGVYYAAFELVTSPLRVPLPLPGDGAFPFNVVPVDFVVEAILEIAFQPHAVGKTFHLVDPNPMSARKVYHYVAERAGKRVPRGRLPAKASVALLRLPILERLARPQRTAIEHLNQLVIYNCRNTLEHLDGTGIRCPPLTAYLDKLLDHVVEQQKKRRAARSFGEAPPEDPLAPPEPAAASEAAEGTEADAEQEPAAAGEAPKRKRRSTAGATRQRRRRDEAKRASAEGAPSDGNASADGAGASGTEAPSPGAADGAPASAGEPKVG